MRLTIRIHEWLADHVQWIQYPNVTLLPERRPFRLRDLTWKQRWWFAFYVFWGSVIALSIYGNLIS
jgi:hypothetical protein